jgi:hypothetical protein
MAEGIRTLRKILADNPRRRSEIDQTSVEHILRFWGHTAPPSAARSEFKAFEKNRGWVSLGIDSNTKEHYRPNKELWDSRGQGKGVPIHFIHAEDDGFTEVFQEEVSRDPRSRGLVLKGGHGGAAYHPRTGPRIPAFVKDCARGLGKI